MAIGRISGPLLKSNLLRNGVDLAFETDLLYLDVNNGRIGINVPVPNGDTSDITHDLTVNGTTHTTNLVVDTQAEIASFTINSNVIASSDSTIILEPSGTNPVVYQGKIVTGSLQLSTNIIETTGTNTDLILQTTGSGVVNINSNMLVDGDLHATGVITADGNITIGDANTDNVVFKADIASNIIPDSTTTWDLGSNPDTGGQEWRNTFTQNLFATNAVVDYANVNGINLTLPQGNIYYVAENGNDTNTGLLEIDPVSSLKHALSLATSGDEVFVFSGTYVEAFPLTVPAGVTIRGAGIRSVKIVPTTLTRYNDAFLLNGDTTVEDISVANFLSGGNYFTVTSSDVGTTTFNAGTAPFAHTYQANGSIEIDGTSYAVSGATYDYTTGITTVLHSGPAATGRIFLSGLTFSCNGSTRVFPDNGYAFRFAESFSVTARSPYVRNCTILTKGLPTQLSVASIVTENNASISRIKDIIDELVVNTSITPSTGNVATQVINPLIVSDGTTGLALQDLIDDVLYVITNGVNPTALPTTVANGSLTSDSNLLNAATIIQNNKEFLSDEMYYWINVTYPTFWASYSETLARRDLGIILDALIYDITHGGNERSVAAGIGFWNWPSNDPLGFDQGNAGKGAFIDGAYALSTSKEASLLFHSATFITPGVDCITAKNGVRVEWLNSFTYFANKGINALSSTYGFARQGKTRLRIDNKLGSWNVGDTLTYYDTDGTTVLASGTIASVDSNYINLTGRQLGFETITDRAAKTVYANGDAKLTTSVFKFGQSSLVLDGTGDFVNVPTQPDFDFGSSDFCLETWVYPTATGTYRTIFDLRSSTGDTTGIILGLSDINALYFFYNGNYRIGPVGSVPVGAWSHIVLARNSGTTKAFVNGIQVGSDYTDANNYPTRGLRIGADPNGNYAFPGYIDDVRISKGVSRYNSNFVVPTTALTGDLSTVLLLHFNGTNNSTTILDDGVTLQDLRVTNGGPTIGTASIINFADYSDFGAEIRSIGSANVYGNYGIYGNGAGVIAYLISQNFAYVGAGKLSSNDPNDRIDANEVVKLNNAKIYYTSVDNEGNFKVGDSFYVNQKTGEVLFNNQSLSITAPEGVTFTDGVHTTTILPTNIDTGNIRISGNTVETLTGDLNITAASGAINLQNDTYVTGNLDVSGDIRLAGNIQIGDQSSDTVTFVGEINSDLIPLNTNSFNLGSISPTELRWKNVYLNRAEIDGLVIDNNTISTTLNDDDLILSASGTGRIYIPSNNVQIDQDLTVNGTSYIDTLSVTNTITSDTFFTGDIQIYDNNITTTLTNSPLTLTANGTGKIYVPSNDVTIDNKLTVNALTTLADVDIGTALLPATVTHIGNITQTGTVTQTGDYHLTGNLTVDGLISQFEDIKLDSNLLTTTLTDSDLNIIANGAGKVYIPNNNVQIDQDLTVNGTSYIDTLSVTNTITADKFSTGDIEIYDNNITTTLLDNPLILTANGTGKIYVPSNDVTIDNKLTVNALTTLANVDIGTVLLPATVTHIGNVTQTGTVTQTGDYHLTGNLTVDGQIAQFEDIKLDGNLLTTTLTDSDLNIVANGTGRIYIPTNNVQIDQDLTVNGTSYIDTLSVTNTITADKFSTGDIEIYDNNITTTIVDSPLILTANGTGKIYVPSNDVTIDNALTVNDLTTLADVDIGTALLPATVTHIGDVNQTGTVTQTGDYHLTGNLTVDGLISQFEDIKLDSNLITTTVTNSDLNIIADGAGIVYIPNNNVQIDQDLTVNGTAYIDTLSVTNTITSDTFFTGDIEIYDNNIRTTLTNSPLTLTANGTGKIYVPSNNVTIDNDLTVNSLTTLSDVNIGTVLLPATVTHIGDVNQTGTVTQIGDYHLTGNLTVDGQITQFQNIKFVSNLITTNVTNSDLNIIADGTGIVHLPNNDVQIDQDLTVQQDLTVTTGTTYLKSTNIVGTLTQTGDINQTGNFVTSGNTEVTGNITGTGYLQLPQIQITGNTVQTTTTNTDLIIQANGTGNIVFESLKFNNNAIESTTPNTDIVLTPQGTGSVVVNSNQSLIIPIGTTAQRPDPASNGMIRYNTDTSRYEARANGYWVKLGSIEDVSGNTRILPEATPGANDNILYFYANNNLTVTIDSTKLYAQKVQTDKLDIYDNTITTKLADDDINITTTGTGGVKIGNLKIHNNTITNTASGAITEFVETGTGYVKIAGTNGVVIPSGDSMNDRPAVKEAGLIRFNTELQLVEVWTGDTWTGVAGVQSGITASDATEIGITSALLFG